MVKPWIRRLLGVGTYLVGLLLAGMALLVAIDPPWRPTPPELAPPPGATRDTPRENGVTGAGNSADMGLTPLGAMHRSIALIQVRLLKDIYEELVRQGERASVEHQCVGDALQGPLRVLPPPFGPGAPGPDSSHGSDSTDGARPPE